MADRRRWRFNAKMYLSPTIFLIATWCRQMQISCATSFFPSQFAKFANGSANPDTKVGCKGVYITRTCNPYAKEFFF